jgi:hypothetical protein
MSAAGTETDLLRAAVLDDVAKFVLADWYEEAGLAETARVLREKAGFVRRVTLSAAYDKRSPDPGKNHGIHGVSLYMALVGPRGAVSFGVFTNWHLPHVTAEQLERRLDADHVRALFCPTGVGVDYHSPAPLREWHKEPTRPACPYLGGRPCYSDGSALAGDEMLQLLIREGDEVVWKALRGWYDDTFSAAGA